MAPQKQTYQEPPEDVPMFLRKAYAMIDTCDPAIAGWTEDGDTFVVKDPTKFERTVIPQFYKHSKFSSFVRQLNFYSFRKIRVMDSVRIDPKLEKETANYWRFRHENFKRGRPDLLREIKRTNGASSSNSNKAGATAAGKEEDKNVKSEVTALKKRIEEMSKNIDELTSMVQQVSLKQEEQAVPSEAELGSKRPRVDHQSHTATFEDNYDIRPDDMLSGSSMMALEDMALAGTAPSAASLPTATTSDEMQQDDFVDSLFTAFKEEEEAGLNFELPPLQDLEPEPVENNSINRPDPVLMQRLSEALTLLPRETQELIINRLIAAITEPVLMAGTLAAAATTPVVSTGKAAHATPSQDEGSDNSPPAATPLAAATLSALIQHCSAELQRKNPSNAHKSIPVIPVHG